VEGLVHERIAHHTALHLAMLGVGNGHGTLKVPVGVVHGAIDGIDDPQRALPGGKVKHVRRRLFRQNAMLREARADGVADVLIGLQVGIGHQLCASLVGRRQPLNGQALTADQFARGFGEGAG
jgi:hypothetical protein